MTNRKDLAWGKSFHTRAMGDRIKIEGKFSWKDFDWYVPGAVKERRKEITRRFNEWQLFIREAWLDRLSDGHTVFLGQCLGAAVPYKTDVPDTFARKSVDWVETQKQKTLVMYDRFDWKWKVKVKVFGMGNRIFKFYPVLHPDVTMRFFVKAYSQLDKIRTGTRHRKCYFSQGRTISAKDELYKRGQWELDLLHKSASIMGLPEGRIVPWADAYNRVIKGTIFDSHSRNNGISYMRFFRYTSVSTGRKYALLDYGWTGTKQTILPDGYIASLTKGWKFIKRGLKGPTNHLSKAIHQAIRLIKREKPEIYLDTDKVVYYLYDKLQEKGETGITIDYLNYVADKLHRRYIHIFKKALIYTKTQEAL